MKINNTEYLRCHKYNMFGTYKLYYCQKVQWSTKFD